MGSYAVYQEVCDLAEPTEKLSTGGPSLWFSVFDIMVLFRSIPRREDTDLQLLNQEQRVYLQWSAF